MSPLLRPALLALAALGCGTAFAQDLVLDARKVSALEGDFEGDLTDGDSFGAAVTSVGDLDGDGVGDLAVGAPGDNAGSEDAFGRRGAVWLLSMNADGSVKDETRLSAESDGLRELSDGDRFGAALASVGDLDGDGIRELAVGAPGDDFAGDGCGAVWILFPDAEGKIKERRRVTAGRCGMSKDSLAERDAFGTSLAAVGDLNGDGFTELAIGTPGIDDHGLDTGGVWILFLTRYGTTKRSVKLSASTGHLGPVMKKRDKLGTALAALGDLNRDGVPDLAAGATGCDDGGEAAGAVWILFLRPDGLTNGKRKISARAGDFGGRLGTSDLFGSALACPGDLDGDGIQELLVGAPSDDDGAQGGGAVWVLSLHENGKVRDERKITSQAAGFEGALHAIDLFGSSLAVLEDLDGVPRPEVVVGAPGDDDGGIFSLTGRGAVWVLFLDDGTYPQARVRNGTGRNELTYSSTNLPFIGQSWIAEIDAGHHEGATLTVIACFDRPHRGLRTVFGEVLVGVRGLGGKQVFRSVSDSGGAIAVHTNPIPYELALVGREAYTQGVILGGHIELVNAIDLRVGY